MKLFYSPLRKGKMPENRLVINIMAMFINGSESFVTFNLILVVQTIIGD